MRKTLRSVGSQTRRRFTAVVVRFGTKPGYRDHGPIPTVLLGNVTIDGEVVADHLWFTKGAWADGISEGDTISFDARVGFYEKGYRGGKAEKLGEARYEYDYRLQRPTKVKIEEVADESLLPRLARDALAGEHA